LIVIVVGPGGLRMASRPSGANNKRIKLSDLRDIRIEMARIYRHVDAAVIPSQEGTRRVYILRQIGDLIPAAGLEKRVIDLEERYEQREQRALPARLN
jgi:hypothetical protein